MTVTQEPPAASPGRGDGRRPDCAGACPGDSDCQHCKRWAAAWEHRGSLLKLARARTSSLHDAEDLVAEAMLRAVDADVPTAALGPWLNTVVRNLSVDLHRDRARDPKRRAFTVRHALADPPLDERLCEQAEARWLHGRLVDLPERQQRALALKASGLPVDAIATAMGETYKSTESLLSRGRAALRRTLQATFAVGAVVLVLPRRWASVGTATAGTAVVLAGLTTALVLPPAGAEQADRAVVQLPATTTSAVSSAAAPVESASRAGGDAPARERAVTAPTRPGVLADRPAAVPPHRDALVPLPLPAAPIVGRRVHQDAPADPDLQYGVSVGPSQAPVQAGVETKDEPEQRPAHDASCSVAALTPATYCHR